MIGDGAPPGRMNDATKDIRASGFCPSCDREYPIDMERCPTHGGKLVRLGAGADALVGQLLDGRFAIRERLGAGGMGAVYRAHQTAVDREVAVKVIDARLGRDPIAARRFLREARLASRLDHPAVVGVHDFGQSEDGQLFIVMELVSGRTLREILTDGGPLAPRRALELMRQLADALDAAHAKGIIHRDLKPGNVMVVGGEGGEHIRVLDFGLARSLVDDTTALTQSDAIMGTPLYMAPEVIRGLGAEPRSDLYALGCMLYELLSGKPPFGGPTMEAVIARQLADPPAPLIGAPDRLAALLRTLLSKEPAERPADAAAVRDELAALAAEVPADSAPLRLGAHPSPQSAPTLPQTPAGRRGGRGAGRIRAAAIAVVVLAGGGAATLWLDRSREPDAGGEPAQPAGAPPAEPSAGPPAEPAPSPTPTPPAPTAPVVADPAPVTERPASSPPAGKSGRGRPTRGRSPRTTRTTPEPAPAPPPPQPEPAKPPEPATKPPEPRKHPPDPPFVLPDE